jgi:hypothetical protein
VSRFEGDKLQFTDMGTLLDDVNSTLRHTWPSNFEILTVETLQTTFDRDASRRSSSSHQHGTPPGNREHSDASALTTTGLRIFLGFFDSAPPPPPAAFDLFFHHQSAGSGSSSTDKGLPAVHAAVDDRQHVCETIGLADFAPTVQEDGTVESFSELVARASTRCATRLATTVPSLP